MKYLSLLSLLALIALCATSNLVAADLKVIANPSVGASSRRRWREPSAFIKWRFAT